MLALFTRSHTPRRRGERASTPSSGSRVMGAPPDDTAPALVSARFAMRRAERHRRRRIRLPEPPSRAVDCPGSREVPGGPAQLAVRASSHEEHDGAGAIGPRAELQGVITHRRPGRRKALLLSSEARCSGNEPEADVYAGVWVRAQIHARRHGYAVALRLRLRPGPQDDVVAADEPRGDPHIRPAGVERTAGPRAVRRRQRFDEGRGLRTRWSRCGASRAHAGDGDYDRGSSFHSKHRPVECSSLMPNATGQQRGPGQRAQGCRPTAELSSRASRRLPACPSAAARRQTTRAAVAVAGAVGGSAVQVRASFHAPARASRLTP